MTGEQALEYRRLAAKYLKLARSISNEQTRLILIDQAQAWLRLAEEQEAILPPPPAPSEAP